MVTAILLPLIVTPHSSVFTVFPLLDLLVLVQWAVGWILKTRQGWPYLSRL